MKNLILCSTIFLSILPIKAQWTDNGTKLTTMDNVGIGTTNPSALLDVFSAKTTDHWPLRINTNSTNWSGFWETSDDIRLLLRDNNGNVDIDLRPDGNSYFNVGNIGVGTTTPSGKLEILKDANLSSSITLPNSGLVIRADNDGNDASLRFGVDNTNLKALIQTQQTTTAAKFDLLLNPFGGNVGIGTTNPQHKMEVYGSNNAIGIGLTNYGWANTNLIGAEYGTWDNGRTNAAGTYFYRWTGSATSYHVGYIGQEMNNGHWGLAFKTDSKNSKIHATSTRMFIDTNGDVGIGTTNPDARLAVNGNIHTKEVKVDLIGWPDYVFEKDYNLPTLEEVEKHIKELGHLKNIPSANEVEKNGIFLGEMEAKLLQKIEELTLYTIQQQKEIENLKQENKELNSLSSRLTSIEKLLESKE